MPLLVVGSVALDSVETPTDRRENVLGGSAVYFSYAASHFSPVRLVGVVGEDWPKEHTELLKQRQIDTQGLQVVSGGKTFRWRGKYLPNMNDRETLEVHLNVFEHFNPKLPADYLDCEFVFLANGSPLTQMKVLEQASRARLVVADTMDLWINIQHMFFSEHETYVMPAYPTSQVIDPTGAGDSFAGGMMGYLAEVRDFSPKALKTAMAYGIVVASFTVEDFSLDRIKSIRRSDIDRRVTEYRQMLAF
jgi:sugar/nucleoside kinase (ribokinase family)